MSVLLWLRSPHRQELVQLLCRGSKSWLQWGVWGSRDKLSTNGSKLHVFQKHCLSRRDDFAETVTTGLQSPMDAVVICMLLIGYHLQMRDESYKNDEFFCFGEKMSPKGSLLDVSLHFRLQKVRSQQFLIFVNSEFFLKMCQKAVSSF